jgi:hypothetical protein
MISIVMGVLLGLLGIIGAVVSNMHGGKMQTALIPLYFGLIFIALGGGSIAKPSLRKHLMHALAAVALVGALMAGIVAAVRWPPSIMARTSMLGMTLLCALTVFFCVRSFIEARKARVAGQTV